MPSINDYKRQYFATMLGVSGVGETIQDLEYAFYKNPPVGGPGGGEDVYLINILDMSPLARTFNARPNAIDIRSDIGAAAATDITGLITVVNGKAPISHTHPVADLSNASTDGKTLITASNFAAMSSLLGTTGGTDDFVRRETTPGVYPARGTSAQRQITWRGTVQPPIAAPGSATDWLTLGTAMDGFDNFDRIV